MKPESYLTKIHATETLCYFMLKKVSSHLQKETTCICGGLPFKELVVSNNVLDYILETVMERMKAEGYVDKKDVLQPKK